jgi:hypothetical protein
VKKKRKEQAVLLWLSLLLTGWASSVGSGGCEERDRERQREREGVRAHHAKSVKFCLREEGQEARRKKKKKKLEGGGRGRAPGLGCVSVTPNYAME